MGRPKLDEDQKKKRHAIMLFKGDYDELGDLYPDIPTAVVIRMLIRQHIRHLNAGKAVKLVEGVEI
jgi:hypothetical protein